MVKTCFMISLLILKLLTKRYWVHWFKSYFERRTIYFEINILTSDLRHLNLGVAQYFFLRPHYTNLVYSSGTINSLKRKWPNHWRSHVSQIWSNTMERYGEFPTVALDMFSLNSGTKKVPAYGFSIKSPSRSAVNTELWL